MSFPHGLRRHWVLAVPLIFGLISACLPAEPRRANQTQVPPPAPASTRTIPSPSATPTSPPDYGENYQAIQLAWFYKPPANNDLQAVARNYSTIILTRMDEEQRDELQTLGVKAPILQYLLFGEIQNPGSCSRQPRHDQVADQVNDFCSLTQQHEDWFLRDVFDRRIAYDLGYTIMDPGSDGWRSFWLERARVSQEQLGWQGVFLDNVEASLDKRLQYGGILKNYLDNASYQAAIEDNLRYLYVNYFKPNGRPLFANIISLNDPAVWFRYLQYLDGAMIENFAVGWHSRYESVAAWELQLNIAEKTQALGKTVILVAQGTESGGTREVFALASYLLVNNGKAYFRYTNDQAYDENWMYDNYGLDLGRPLGTRYKVGDTWKRDFENGAVSVNPTSHIAKIDVLR